MFREESSLHAVLLEKCLRKNPGAFMSLTLVREESRFRPREHTMTRYRCRVYARAFCLADPCPGVALVLH